jgi:hypothetical protein
VLCPLATVLKVKKAPNAKSAEVFITLLIGIILAR